MNIARAAEIDPWPRYGLVAKYKPFILNRIKPFLQNNGHLNRNEVITDAIRVTWECSRGSTRAEASTSRTRLRHWLPNTYFDLYAIENQRRTLSRTSSKPSPCDFWAAGMAPVTLDTGSLVIGARMTVRGLSDRRS